ncbi:MAG: primosomal protein N' [Acidobacteria bacterium]|nr:primosomal protein N' [Acidobacteriota bacterium]
MRLIRVAVPVPGLEALTYSVPVEMPLPVSGARVLVPLGKRVMTGVVIGTEDGTPEAAGAGTLKPILDVLDSEPFLPGEVISLGTWVAEYYACGIGEAIAAAMPPRAWIEGERHVRITEAGLARLLTERGLRRRLLDELVADRPVPVGTLAGEARGARSALLGLDRDGLVSISQPLVGTASAFRTVRVASLTAQGHDMLPEAAGNGTPSDGEETDIDNAGEERAKDRSAGQSGTWTPGARQREALLLLRGAPEGIDTADLTARGIGAPTLKRLAGLGLISFTRRRVERDPFVHAAARGTAVRQPVTLTAEQAAAMHKLQALAGTDAFSAVVLHGVTGSGKTELYLRLAQHVASSGRGVLVLVPEIALTPAIAGAFRAAFGERVAIQHSGLSDGERHDQWHRIRRGEVDVVVGTRSAVFAPVQRLGLVIVDEEHDTSYKQEESPRYNGRDVAVVRARAVQALAVLGSATPSLESYHNAQSGRYELITLERRVLDRPMAAVRLVDMRAEYAAAGPDVVISTELAQAIRERLDLGEQAMVLLNRRGFATSVFCRQCGGTLECPNCSVSLTVHRAARRARCHYCNHAMRIPTTCSHCAGTFLEQAGFGTERVEAELATLFPGARLARVDRDTVRRRGAITALLERFGAGHIDVLVGTQMIAKGHDFPRVTLVGVVSADVGLGLADFRAGERTFHLLTQVAGRAGRGEVAGEAVVQTIHPGHYSITHACRQDYAAFYREEINFRRTMKYPPTVALINAVVKGSTLEGALADAGAIVQALRWGGEPYRVLGPAPAPLSRLKGEHRAQLFIKGTHRSAMRKALQGVLEARPEIRRRTIVDVDPMSVL